MLAKRCEVNRLRLAESGSFKFAFHGLQILASKDRSLEKA